MNERTAVLPRIEVGSAATTEFAMPSQIAWAEVVLPHSRDMPDPPSWTSLQRRAGEAAAPSGDENEVPYSDRLMHVKADELTDRFRVFQSALASTEQDGTVRYDQTPYIPGLEEHDVLREIATKTRSGKELRESGFDAYEDNPDSWYFVPDEYLATDGPNGEIRVISSEARAGETGLRAEPVDPGLKARIDHLIDPSLGDLSAETQEFLAGMLEPKTRRRHAFAGLLKLGSKDKDAPVGPSDAVVDELRSKIAPGAQNIDGAWLQQALADNNGQRARQLLLGYHPTSAPSEIIETHAIATSSLYERGTAKVPERPAPDQTRVLGIDMRAGRGAKWPNLEPGTMAAQGWSDPRLTLMALVGRGPTYAEAHPDSDQLVIAEEMTARVGEVEGRFLEDFLQSLAGFDQRRASSPDDYPDNLNDPQTRDEIREFMNLYSGIEELVKTHLPDAMQVDENGLTTFEGLVMARLAAIRSRVIAAAREQVGLQPFETPRPRRSR